MSKLDDLYDMVRREGDYDPAEDILRDPVCRRVMAVVPEEIDSRDAEIARLTAEVTTLRARCERLSAEASVAREWNKLRNAKRGAGLLSDWQKRLSRARQACDAHNDLKEPTDG